MPGIPAIKATAKLLANQGRADEVGSFIDSVLERLSPSDQAELQAWVMANGPAHVYDGGLPDVERNWKRVTRHMRAGETLKDVYPRLPEDLQDFLREQATKGRS